jgi:tetratricopeptide (TPR) repeat protein
MVDRIDFGADLRRRRQLAGVSLSQFAVLVHYSKGYLSKIESGSQAVQPAFARLCDAALNANGELIALAAAPANVEQPDEPDDDGPCTGSWSMSLDPDGTGYFTQVTGTGQDVAAAPFGPTAAAARYAADPSTTLTLFRSRFEQARLFAQIVSAALALPMLIAETHAVRGLASNAPEEASAGLWRLAAQYAEFVGWMTQESGNDQQALWWTRMAVRMAAHAGDESLRPFALVRQADVTLHADDAYQTIELAQQAQAHSAATARIRGLAAQREAQGYALLGDRDTCLRALDRSARLLDEAAGAPGALMLGTWRTPDTTVMARGWCMFDLGRPAEAAELLEPGIAGFPDGASRARARYALRTALAHATADEIERACEIVEWLAADLRQIDSATVRHDVRLLHREFRRRAAQPRVRELLPLLADLMRGPSLDRG